MREEAEEKPDMLRWKYGACFPRPRPCPALGSGPSAAPGGPPEVSGFVLAAADGRHVRAQLEAATLRLLAWLRQNFSLRNHDSGSGDAGPMKYSEH